MTEDLAYCSFLSSIGFAIKPYELTRVTYLFISGLFYWLCWTWRSLNWYLAFSISSLCRFTLWTPNRQLLNGSVKRIARATLPVTSPVGQRSNSNPDWATQLGLEFRTYSRQSRQWIFSLVELHVPSKVSRCPYIAPLFVQQRRRRPSEIGIRSPSARIDHQTIEIRKTVITAPPTSTRNQDPN